MVYDKWSEASTARQRWNFLSSCWEPQGHKGMLWIMGEVVKPGLASIINKIWVFVVALSYLVCGETISLMHLRHESMARHSYHSPNLAPRKLALLINETWTQRSNVKWTPLLVVVAMRNHLVRFLNADDEVKIMVKLQPPILWPLPICGNLTSPWRLPQECHPKLDARMYCIEHNVMWN